MPTQDKEKAPNCPKCGQFMDKVEALITDQLGGGTVEISTSGSDTKVSWVCPNPKCNQPKAEEKD